MKTRIDIKDYHIAQGKRENPYSCPIAQALREKKILFHGVTQEGIDFIHPERNAEPIPLPDEATSFIHEFDEGKKVKPFSFEVEIPQEYLQ